MSIWESIKKKWNSIFNKGKALPEGEDVPREDDWAPLEGEPGSGVGEVITPEEGALRTGISEIEPNLEDIHQIGVLDSPMGEGRHDKSVYLKTKEDTYTRTSNIMMGKKESSLTDRKYINLDEVSEALEKYLMPEDETVRSVIVKAKKTGKRIETEELKELVKEAVKQKGELLVAGGMPTIKNQETASLYVKEEGDKDFTRKGVMFLGKDKIELPTGEYVSEEEIKKALNDYMMVVDKKEVKESSELPKISLEELPEDEGIDDSWDDIKKPEEKEEEALKEDPGDFEDEVEEELNEEIKKLGKEEGIEESESKSEKPEELEEEPEVPEVHKVVSRKKLPNIMPVIAAIGTSVVTFVIGTETIEAEMIRNAKLKKQGIEVEAESSIEEPIVVKKKAEPKAVYNDKPQNIPESRRKYVEEWKKIRKDDDLDR